ncbi:MAG: ATP synthase F1 subunit epsilon [Candidatus Cloacimonetes bacterium 4572_65]|nr:MAG: ATP synthase F1 subunit epsilon [Candidatus Cloacimonetes bacterium 4572_65]
MVKIKVILPQGVKIDKECDSVTIPGLDGDFAVLEGHTSMISILRPGVMTIDIKKNSDNYAMHDGFVTIEDNLVTVVCERMETKTEIDKERTDKALDRAKKRLADVNSKEIDFRRAELSLRRALTRITVLSE